MKLNSLKISFYTYTDKLTNLCYHLKDDGDTSKTSQRIRIMNAIMEIEQAVKRIGKKDLNKADGNDTAVDM